MKRNDVEKTAEKIANRKQEAKIEEAKNFILETLEMTGMKFSDVFADEEDFINTAKARVYTQSLIRNNESQKQKN